MKKKVLLIFVFITFFSEFIIAQSIQNKAFKGGEKLKFVGSYYMSQLWTDLAEINIDVNEVNESGTPVYRIIGRATTYASWDKFFKIRDSYQSWIDPVTTLPLIFKRDMEEGGYTKDEKYVFRRKSLTVVATQIKKNGNEERRPVKITADTHDMVSVVYYIRNLPFETYKANQTVNVPVLIDEKIETIVIKFKGTETIQVGKFGSKKCYKVGVNIKNPDIVKTTDANNVWLTADANRVPVLIKADIPVGSIQIRLTEMQGLKN